MSTRHFDLAASAAARCAGPLENSHVMSCERTLRIGFFFDGFGRHLLKDLQSGRVSNVGKLYLAHPVDMPNQIPDPFFAYRKAYISGLGEDYDADLTTMANGSLDSFGGAVSEVPREVTVDQGVEALKDALKQRNWWERLKHDLGELGRHPAKAARVLKGAVVDATTEAVAPLRDSPIAAQLLKSGANTRIDGAIDRLNKDIDELRALGGPPLKRIELSVYGFDYGATLARGFLHRLLGRCLIDGEKVEYQGIHLVVLFAGLFDAVDRSHIEVPLLDELLLGPLRNVLGDAGSLPPQVRQVLHLVAAHERRFYRRAHLLGTGNPKWREELMPGVSEDVGGSLLPGEQKPSAELALVSLHRMYQAAFRAGVPFPHIEDLYKQGRKLNSMFIYDDHIAGKNAHALVRHYQRAAELSVAQLRGLDLGQQGLFLGHMRLYIRWLAALWRPYEQRLREIGDEEDRLHASQFQAGNSRGLLGLPQESREHKLARLQRSGELQAEREALQAQLGWLEDVDSEARHMRAARTEYAYAAAGGARQLDVWNVLLDHEWFNARPQPLPDEVSLLFGHFIHDQLVQSTAQRSAKSLGGQRYFDTRGFDMKAAT
ncbi:DUF2235 domain-containing protein [Stutzerimonas nitrititolerans]|uniref:DUF2235 domain-containing protein n=1 Tax=Stutzerimonas nitrititolerans TaxID=2482751 RepID=UPI00289EAB17|nr:DUF2235 domain-containing protein [Stutzerimonas nitrititolerans]